MAEVVGDGRGRPSPFFQCVYFHGFSLCEHGEWVPSVGWLAPPILKGPTSFLMDLVAHDCSQKVGNFGDRLWGVSMILVS